MIMLNERTTEEIENRIAELIDFEMRQSTDIAFAFDVIYGEVDNPFTDDPDDDWNSVSALDDELGRRFDDGH